LAFCRVGADVSILHKNQHNLACKKNMRPPAITPQSELTAVDVEAVLDDDVLAVGARQARARAGRRRVAAPCAFCAERALAARRCVPDYARLAKRPASTSWARPAGRVLDQHLLLFENASQ
jgi:hypothetical protein